MTFDLKTTLFAAGYFVTCLSFVFAFFYKLKSVEKENEAIKKIIFLEKGGLNVVTTYACKDFQREINQKINIGSSITKEALEQIKCLSDNIIIIMTKMELEPRTVPHKDKKTFRSIFPGGES